MLIINHDSILITIGLLKTINLKDNIVFFNDGVRNHQIMDLIIEYKDFEVNGMYQCIESSYKLVFNNAQSIEFYEKNGEINFHSRSLPIPHEHTGIPLEVSKYNF